jgi:4-hydroxy-tetrahydrodipicolinate synthase
MIDTVSAAWRLRPDFQLISGDEYMVSAGTIGATGMLSGLAGVAPKLVRRLYDVCRTEKYFDARKDQEDAGALYQAVKRAGRQEALKGAMRYMGREVGTTRPPLDALKPERYEQLAIDLGRLAFLKDEPRGW